MHMLRNPPFFPLKTGEKPYMAASLEMHVHRWRLSLLGRVLKQEYKNTFQKALTSHFMLKTNGGTDKLCEPTVDLVIYAENFSFLLTVLARINLNLSLKLRIFA